jgi:hypothetical protein
MHAGRRRAGLALALGALLFAGSLAGERISERDWDAFACTLRQPGEMLLQRIAVPRERLARAGGVQQSWLEIDMLRSLRGSFTLEVLVGGQVVKTFTDTLGGAYDQFLFNEEMHGAFVQDYLGRRGGTPGPGYDYFRRWVPVKLPITALATDTLEVGLRLTQVDGGGWVKVFADRHPAMAPRHRFVGPAIGENPYDHSNYRAEFFAGDRLRMDARLTRPRTLQSPWAQSLRVARGTWTPDLDPRWGHQGGELRIRVRAQLCGMLLARPKAEGGFKPVWTQKKRDGDRALTVEEYGEFQLWRDKYFDGTWVL